MQLTDEQKATIHSWIQEGSDLAAVQKRLKETFGISITYLEARFLADDLKLAFQDKAEPEEPKKDAAPESPSPLADTPAPAAGKVSVRIDQITRPGSIVSGGVTFSDGQTAMWYLDQMGRLGLDPATPGYRPTQQDVQDFQIELEKAHQLVDRHAVRLKVAGLRRRHRP